MAKIIPFPGARARRVDALMKDSWDIQQLEKTRPLTQIELYRARRIYAQLSFEVQNPELRKICVDELHRITLLLGGVQ